MKPPVAKIIPSEVHLHGDLRRDEYAWMREKMREKTRDKSDPEVIAYLEAENAYTDFQMAGTKQLQEQLYEEMLARIQQTDLSVPYLRNGYFYYSRTVEGKQYPIHCRKRGSLEADEQILLDLNLLAEGEKFMALGAFTVSDDARFLAYSIDNTGFRQYTLAVKNLDTGDILPERRAKTGSVAWAADNRTLFYTVEDQAKRQYRLYRHELGADADDLIDDLIYEEPDERFRLSAWRSRSQAFLFLMSSSHTASEARFLAAGDPAGEWRLVTERRPEHEYDITHRGDLFYIRTNRTGRNFGLATAPVAEPGNWTDIQPAQANVMLGAVDLFAGHMVAWEREDGLPHLRVYDLAGGESHRIAVPEPVYMLTPDHNAEFESRVFRYGYQSPVTPHSVFDYDMDTRKTTLLKRTEVLGGYDAGQYRCERLHATAADGTRIPISLVYRPSLRNPPLPLLLYGYGSYGISLPVGFNSNRFSLLDRGVIYAMAHVRGGGELGKTWHDAGRMENKENTFTDFISCAQFLIEGAYTAPDRLVIMGGSAGGLLMGAVANRRPELFHAVVSVVPFVDVVNTMLDESLPLTVGEFEEWGNPRIREHYERIRAYCPYSNLEAKAYPAMLVKTSLHDSQVMYWEAAKYVARLRAVKTDANPLLLKINMAAGHGGASGRYDALRETAFEYAFILGKTNT